MSRGDAPQRVIAWLDNKSGLPDGDSLLSRLESDDPHTNNTLRCLANNKAHLRCRSRVKRNSQEHDIALGSFQELNSTPIDQLEVIGRIWNRIRPGSIFCFPHKERVQNMFKDELDITDNAEPHLELTPQRTNEVAPMNLASKTPKGMHRNNAKTGQVQVEPNDYSKSIKKVCQLPFVKGKDEPHLGVIYALQYTSPEYRDFLKIGYTTRTVESRADEIIYRSEPVMHPSRIESFVHKQLNTLRYTKPNCPSCNKSHKELFRIKEEDVESKIDSKVKRWAKWMSEEEPYTVKKGEGGVYRFYFKPEKESSLDHIIGEFINEATLAGDLYRRRTASSTPLSDNSLQSREDTTELESNVGLTTIDDENRDPEESIELTATTESPSLPRHAEEIANTVVASSSAATPSRPFPETRRTKTSSLIPSRRPSVARSQLAPVSFDDTLRDQPFRSQPSALLTPDKTPSPRFENTKIASETEAISWEQIYHAESSKNSFSYAADEFYRIGDLSIDFTNLRLLNPEVEQRLYKRAKDTREECIQNRSSSYSGSFSYAADDFYRIGDLGISFTALRLLNPEAEQRFYNLAKDVRADCRQNRSTAA